MCTGNPVQHHESGTVRRNRPDRSQRPRCVFSKEPRPSHDDRRRGINISGVDFWHAVEFSRNGRFLCTHPLGLSSGLPFGVSDSIRSFLDPISSVLSRFPLPRFPFRRFRLYQILSGLSPSQRGLPSRPLGRSDVSNLSGLSLRSQIEEPHPNRIEFGRAEFIPAGRSF